MGDVNKVTGQTTFSAGGDVASFWESKAVPSLEKKAVDLKALLEESKGNLTNDAIGKKYGKVAQDSSGDINYTVKGTATVQEVNQALRAGYLTVGLNGYTGKEPIKLQIGTVFLGTSVRDSLDFLNYNDYQNQVQWGSVSQSINKTVQQKVIGPLKVTELKGKTIDFVGCFTAEQGDDQILITPVKITVK